MNTQNAEQSELPDEKYVNSILVKLLEYNKPVTAYELLSITARNYNVLMKRLRLLEDRGYVEIKETKQHGSKGRKVYLIRLTEKGRIVAEALKKAEWTAKLTHDELEKFKNLRALIHVNIYEDHITVMDIHMGHSRIANIYAKPKGHEVYFWCDLHDDTDCYHIEYMFADPKLSDFIRSWIEKNGFKLSKKYGKYVERYW